MAIAFDAVSHTWGNTVTSLTIAHTCTGSNLVLVVFSLGYSNQTTTGITYNGVSLTKIVAYKPSIADTFEQSVWYLLNPATGANNIIASYSGSGGAWVGGLSYTGCNTSSQPDVYGTSTKHNNLTSDSLTLTTNNNDEMIVAGGCKSNALSSAGSGTTSRYLDNILLNATYGDAVATTAGSNSFNLTFGAGAYDNYIYGIALKPYTASTVVIKNIPTLLTLGVG